MSRLLFLPKRRGICPLVLALSLAVAAGAARAAEPAPAPVWDADAARHLLSRIAFGAAPEEVARLAGMPLEKAVDTLLDEAERAEPLRRPDWVRDVWVHTSRRYGDDTVNEYLLLTRATGERDARHVNQLRAEWVRDMITTRTPLHEVMVLFWHGHFTGSTQKVRIAQAQYLQHALFERNALGNFRTLLGEVTLDPAMLMYLDLEESNKAHPNENYARELLELFTLGVGHYSERDILEIARALTGWTLDAPPGTIKPKREEKPDAVRSQLRDGLIPQFRPERHDDGEKTVFGQTGRFGVEEVLDLIVRQPACGPYFASRLIDFFGAADPEGTLRDRLSAAFRDGGYEVKPMLRILLTSPEFYASASRSNHIKSPARLLVGAWRQLQLEGEVTPRVTDLTIPMGQELLNPPTVQGWVGGRNWISASTLAMRTRLGDVLIAGEQPAEGEPLGRLRLLSLSRIPAKGQATLATLLAIDRERKEKTHEDAIDVHFDARRLYPQGVPDDPALLVDSMLARLVVTPVRNETRSALLDACRAVSPDDRPALVARLILATPEYQLD